MLRSRSLLSPFLPTLAASGIRRFALDLNALDAPSGGSGRPPALGVVSQRRRYRATTLDVVSQRRRYRATTFGVVCQRRRYRATTFGVVGQRRRYRATTFGVVGQRRRYRAPALDVVGQRRRHRAPALGVVGQRRRHRAPALDVVGQRRRHRAAPFADGMVVCSACCLAIVRCAASTRFVHLTRQLCRQTLSTSRDRYTSPCNSNPELGLSDPMSFLQGSANAPVQSAAGAEIVTR
jgi:hypothetical protein